MGFVFAILAGAAMSVQGVMNTRLSEKLGLYESNAWVQGTAFALSLLAMWIWGKGSFRELGQTPKIYLLGGALGLVITLTVMLAIGRLSPTVAISTILIAQLSSRPSSTPSGGSARSGSPSTGINSREWR